MLLPPTACARSAGARPWPIFSRKPHCAWLGPTGAGKSSAVAAVRVNGERPTLCAMPDKSDPLLDATRRLGGFVWTASESSVPINFLIGSPSEVAERLTEVFRSGGGGAWKREVRLRTAVILRELDDQGVPRTLHAIGERLRDEARADKNLSQVCAGWVARFLDLADQFGSSIAPDGVAKTNLDAIRGMATIPAFLTHFRQAGEVSGSGRAGDRRARRAMAS
jgi:hypothetical protein